ncbi:cyclodeaminase/cyclohydrolase family protein [Desulfovibrio sp. OttesenSCG-928-I05]|nr:cyclodeaminase/cyclohydrolase family protein [Desulfovibrio sp. OttesenSCG-928-I05]
MLAEKTITGFTQELASDSPAPGGGSVAALAGAMAAALTAMVGRLTVGKEKYKDAWSVMEGVRDEADALSAKFLDLMEKDTEAFNAYMAAMKLPKDTDEAKAARKAAMQKAAQESTAIPLRTMECCLEAAKLGDRAAQYGNPNALSDAGTAVLLGKAGGRAAMYNVLINLSGIADAAFVEDHKKRSEAIMAELDGIAIAVDGRVMADLSA